MKFPKLRRKDWIWVAALAALAFFVWTISRQRENFKDNGWKMDDGTLLSVSITEDGTLWGITPDNAIWKKTKGGSWGLTKGRAAPGANICGASSTEAYTIGGEMGAWKTTDGGETWSNLGGGAKAKWITGPYLGGAMVVGTDGQFQQLDNSSSKPIGGGGIMLAGTSPETLYCIVPDGQVWKWSGSTWQNQGYMARFIAVDKSGSLVQLGTDGKLYQRAVGSKDVIPFSGTVRNISASTTMLAATTTDNKTWTMDITGSTPAPAAPAAPAAAPAAPSPSSAPGLSAGSQSATCPQCSVSNGQISCACDVLPKA